MDAIGQYILSVICAVILCGMVQMFFVGGAGSLIKLITGLAVTIVAVGPILQGDLQLDMDWDEISFDSRLVAQEGENAALDAISMHIKESTETYILDKAEDMNVEITVEVELDATMLPKPVSATVCGIISPYVKRQLADCMKQDLGIDEDRQRWIS